MSEFRMKPRCRETVSREFHSLPKAVRLEIAHRFGLLEGLEETAFHPSVWGPLVINRAKERRKWSPFDDAVRKARWTQQGIPWM